MIDDLVIDLLIFLGTGTFIYLFLKFAFWVIDKLIDKLDKKDKTKCEFCKTKDKIIYQTNRYCDLYFLKFGNKTFLTADVKGFCPKYQKNCSSKGRNPQVMFEINYCPNCGAKMEKELNNE